MTTEDTRTATTATQAAEQAGARPPGVDPPQAGGVEQVPAPPAPSSPPTPISDLLNAAYELNHDGYARAFGAAAQDAQVTETDLCLALDRVASDPELARRLVADVHPRRDHVAAPLDLDSSRCFACRGELQLQPGGHLSCRRPGCHAWALYELEGALGRAEKATDLVRRLADSLAATAGPGVKPEQHCWCRDDGCFDLDAPTTGHSDCAAATVALADARCFLATGTP